MIKIVFCPVLKLRYYSHESSKLYIFANLFRYLYCRNIEGIHDLRQKKREKERERDRERDRE